MEKEKRKKANYRFPRQGRGKKKKRSAVLRDKNPARPLVCGRGSTGEEGGLGAVGGRQGKGGKRDSSRSGRKSVLSGQFLQKRKRKIARKEKEYSGSRSCATDTGKGKGREGRKERGKNRFAQQVLSPGHLESSNSL